jgi:hypothetical protein|tara:strand:+ start:133 stop:588 length:456 start_codon:yes stop_codon:yes gene_type:complete
MANFAKISEENKVLSVLVLDNINNENSEGAEVESIGQSYLEQHNNWPAHLWIKTSINTYNNTHKLNGTPFRGNYAAIGYDWDSENQIFWLPQPYPSWTQDTSTASWVSPAGPSPDVTAEQFQQTNVDKTHSWFYVWNEQAQSWDLTDFMAS